VADDPPKAFFSYFGGWAFPVKLIVTDEPRHYNQQQEVAL
jgi:hypothetical protein